jgi:hypothetical protein
MITTRFGDALGEEAGDWGERAVWARFGPTGPIRPGGPACRLGWVLLPWPPRVGGHYRARRSFRRLLSAPPLRVMAAALALLLMVPSLCVLTITRQGDV